MCEEVLLAGKQYMNLQNLFIFLKQISGMATAVLFVYSTAGKEKHEVVSISRQLFGFNDKSKRGKYSYNRKGVLDPIVHAKLARGCIAVGEKDEKKIGEFFNKRKIEFRKFKLSLSKKETEDLFR